MKKTIFFLYIACLFNAFSQVPSSVGQSLDSILTAALPANYNGSGVIMRVTVPGQWSWSGAVGKGISGNTSGQPATVAQATDHFRAGSITKMMVATCILKLQQDGLLSIEDPIGNYLRSTLVNDTIQSSEVVKIRHLLNHTSGIANSADNLSCQQNVLQNPLASHTLEEAVNCGASQGEIFPPGFAWAYSNTNYTLLAMIIEEVTGMSYSSYLNQTIITPLNLTQTEIPVSDQLTSSHMGCYWNIGSWIDLTIVDPTTYTGWADLVSTTEDLISFYEALQNGQLINTAQLAIMRTIDAASYDYGMGLDFYTLYGTNYTGHYGEVANTSGLFFGQTGSAIAPNGYYISYNFNVQGADMINKIDKPVMQLMLAATAGLETQQTSKIQLSPNPAMEMLEIFFGEVNAHKVTIIGSNGQEVYSADLQSSSTHQVNCSSFEAGFYFVNVYSNHGVSTQRLIIQ